MVLTFIIEKTNIFIIGMDEKLKEYLNNFISVSIRFSCHDNWLRQLQSWAIKFVSLLLKWNYWAQKLFNYFSSTVSLQFNEVLLWSIVVSQLECDQFKCNYWFDKETVSQKSKNSNFSDRSLSKAVPVMRKSLPLHNSSQTPLSSWTIVLNRRSLRHNFIVKHLFAFCDSVGVRFGSNEWTFFVLPMWCIEQIQPSFLSS